MEPTITIAVVGATATGKSDLALDLAAELNGEILNTDSMQLYRGMDIGTAKTPVAQRRSIPHHQLDVLDVHQEASVAAYQKHARNDLESLYRAKKPVVAVGGSGLYVRALFDQLEFPPTDSEVRAAIEEEARNAGTRVIYDRLHELDPVAATNIGPHNTRRIVRALEVIQLTGRPYSATMPRHEYKYPAIQIGVAIERDDLRERILTRAQYMFKNGLIEETESLISAGLREGKTASKATGYAQALAVIAREMTIEEAIESTATATQQLARRQITWFKKDPRVIWVQGGTGVLERARSALR